MYRILALGIATIAAFQGPALAGVSDDLVFCSKLTSPRERIACYDAAARIAANSGSKSAEQRSIVSAPAGGTPVPQTHKPLEISQFQGFYAAVGGGYGISGPRQSNVFPFGFANTLAETSYANGWSISGVGGYNVVSGPWLFGLEFDARYSRESGGVEGTVNEFIFGTGTEFLRYQIKNDAGLHLSARIGAIFDNTLVFAKFGAGASHIVEEVLQDARNASFCANLFCTALAPGPSRQGSKAAWVPSYLFGVGLERNFGMLFFRASGELEAAQLQETRIPSLGGATSDLYWTARAMVAVGVRF